MESSVKESSVKTSLKAEALRADPRIAEARCLIAEAVAEHGAAMTEPKDADPALAADYENLLQRLGETRGGPPFWPYLSSGLGNGPMIELADGSIKLDFIGGIGVHGCGHSHPAMIDGSIDGALEDTVMQGNLQQHPPSVQISERLIALANKNGAAMDHCILSTSGAMANETRSRSRCITSRLPIE